MPVDSKHPMYSTALSQYCKNAYYGDVKDYIPRPKAQSQQEYKNYQNRATYFNVVRRTTHALCGAVTRKPIKSNIDLSMINVDGQHSFKQLVSQLIENLLLTGRYGVYVDYSDSKNEPYLVTYDNDDIINWFTDEDDNLTSVMINCEYYVRDPKDRFQHKAVHGVRELFLDSEGVFTVVEWTKDSQGNWKPGEPIVPEVRGNTLNYIPMVIENVTGGIRSCEPILMNLAQINISHLCSVAELEHAAYFTSIPQPWIAGDLKQAPGKEGTQVLNVGSEVAWQLKQGSQVGFLEFNGAGINSIQDIIRDKVEQMVALGSRLLQDKKGVESVEALRLRQASEGASLIGIIDIIEQSLTTALNWYVQWLTPNAQRVEVDIDRNIISESLTPQMIQQLINGVLNNQISQQTFVEALYKGEIVEDVQQEMERLAPTQNNE